jgi:hypothetical protein
MFVRSASSLIALAILTAACDHGNTAEPLGAITIHPGGQPRGTGPSADGGGQADDADEVGRIVQKGQLAFEAPKTGVIDVSFERHAYLLEVDGETVVSVRAEGRSGDLIPSISIHAPLYAGFNPQELAISETVEAGEAARLDTIVLPEAGVYLVVVGSEGEGRGEYTVVASCDGGACAQASAVPSECLPEVAEAVFACADRVMDQVDSNPEDGVLTSLDALHLCTRPQELAPIHFELCGDTLCDGPIGEMCTAPFEVFAEAQGAACLDALREEVEAPLDMTEIPMPTKIAKALDEAVASRCAEASCTIRLAAYAYGDQYPALKEATLVAAALSNPEASGTYSHASAWELAQRLSNLEIEDVVADLRSDLDIERDPVVGRLFGANPIAEDVDLLVETHVALFRSDRVIVTIEVAQPTS